MRHRKWKRLMAFGAGCVPVMAGAGPWMPVRNLHPQQVVQPAGEQRPIYYPRLAHRGAPDEVGQDQADRLLGEFLDLHTAMSYEQAALLARRLTEILPEQPAAHYNLACALGRLHRIDESLSSLERAVECGWRDRAHLSIDPDLDCIRGTDRYRRLVARLAADQRPEADRRTSRGWRQVVTRLQHRAPAELLRLGAPPATVVLVDRGQVVWAGCIGAPGGEPAPLVGPDDAIALSSCDQLLALADRVSTPPPDRAILASLTSEDIAAGAARCRRQVLRPLGMTGTWFEARPGREIVAHSTARDLAVLAAAASAAAQAGAASASGPDASHELSGAIGSGPAASAVVRWAPGEGRGIVVVSTGERGLDAARRIAQLSGLLE